MKVQEIPSFDIMFFLVPQEIKDYLIKSENISQRPDFHPEGNTLKHIKLVYNRALKSNDINQVISALFHDLGKIDTTTTSPKTGYPTSPDHEKVSAELVMKYKNWIESFGGDIEQIFEIVSNHMRMKRFDEMKMSKQEKLMSNKFYDKFLEFTKMDDMFTLTPHELEAIK